MDEYLPKLGQILKNPIVSSQAEMIAMELMIKRTAFTIVEAIYSKVPQKGKAPEKVHQKEHHKELIKHSEAVIKRR